MMVDADGFKQINDLYGHDAGDEVLRQAARNMRYAVRTDDIVCRLGGDEFFIICPRTPLDGALQLAEKMRAAIAALRIPAGSGEWRGSISVGVAQRLAGMWNIEDLVKAADQGVYAAKGRGRNCVATAG
jgi:hemerythrin